MKIKNKHRDVKITMRDVQNFEEMTSGSFDTAGMSPKEFQQVANIHKSMRMHSHVPCPLMCGYAMHLCVCAHEKSQKGHAQT